MINNFEQIKGLLKFDSPDEFYQVSVLQRVKENLHLNKNSNLVKNYYPYNLEYLDRKKDEIIKLCEIFNARCYISLNRRNAKVVGLEMMSNLADSIRCNEIHSLDKLFNSTCSKHHSEKDKKWLIDIDTKEISPLLLAHLEISCRPYTTNKVIARIQTKNGWHLITTAFDKQTFKEKYPEVDIQVNSMTILYIP